MSIYDLILLLPAILVVATFLAVFALFVDFIIHKLSFLFKEGE